LIGKYHRDDIRAKRTTKNQTQKGLLVFAVVARAKIVLQVSETEGPSRLFVFNHACQLSINVFEARNAPDASSPKR